MHETGRREIIGIDVGEAETEAFWTAFLRGLVKGGLIGVQLAISDAHPGLKAAIAQVLGAPWQRCTVHFLRDCLGHARKDQHGLLAALIRPLFNQPDEKRLHRDTRTDDTEAPPRAPTGLSSHLLTDAHGANVLHHVPGLDSVRALDKTR